MSGGALRTRSLFVALIVSANCPFWGAEAVILLHTPGLLVTDLSKFIGDYSEEGRWRDASGDSGELCGGISVSLNADQLRFSVDDGHEMVAQLSGDSSQPLQFEGSGGGATSAGKVYVGQQSLVLEYTAHVNGRDEQNVDVWTVNGRDLQRAGIIRQDGRTIWFEARMIRTG